LALLKNILKFTVWLENGADQWKNEQNIDV